MRLDPAMHRFLAASYNVRLATLSPRGTPLITPIWFNLDGDEIVIGTAASALAVRNARANPQVVLCFDAEGLDGNSRVLRLHGTAVVRDEWLPLRLLAKLVFRYYLAPAALRCEFAHFSQQRLRGRYYAKQTGPALIRIQLEQAEFLPHGGAIDGIHGPRLVGVGSMVQAPR